MIEASIHHFVNSNGCDRAFPTVRKTGGQLEQSLAVSTLTSLSSRLAPLHPLSNEVDGTIYCVPLRGSEKVLIGFGHPSKLI